MFEESHKYKHYNFVLLIKYRSTIVSLIALVNFAESSCPMGALAMVAKPINMRYLARFCC